MENTIHNIVEYGELDARRGGFSGDMIRVRKNLALSVYLACCRCSSCLTRCVWVMNYKQRVSIEGLLSLSLLDGDDVERVDIVKQD